MITTTFEILTLNFKLLHLLSYTFHLVVSSFKLEQTILTDDTKNKSPVVELSKQHSFDEVEESLCFICLREIQPNLYSGKGGKGLKVKGKKKATKTKDIDWVFCDYCNKWLHCLCESVCLKDLGEKYMCSVCKHKNS